MAKIFYNTDGNFSGGGPSVHVARMKGALSSLGHTLTSNATEADIAMCIIVTNNILNKVDRKKTKVILRIDGIYNKIYNEKFNRAIRPDMVALHTELQRDIPLLDHVVYQSQWSKDRIDDEIVVRTNNYSIIHNGVDLNAWKPYPTERKDKFVKLFHVGFMRDAYLMEMLIGVFKELTKRKHQVQLLLYGSMDGGCSRVYNANRDKNIIHTGHIKNTALPREYAKGDIYLDVRQGASCNNTVAEAQACGLPVITPSWGGSCEMIKDKATGVVVDGGQWDYNQNYVNNIANAVEFIMPNLKDFKKRARKHAEAQLGLDTMVNNYLKAMGLK